ncbi:bifunctional serine/threonine-protein kinase/ABC transporter substrate-binding protein [Nostoc sp. FACHB-110]|uniref:bifunctional serine/threonine-protein kinase/ABC transporter substrate-binding protein n=1 Tax=Nostoc sp. FACHB-110 TaxID=2692834 RepID=UPI001686135A|nr:bifunctional serine/threonine-protein kinase/ABC transporter substrate-binding protein [Nostoc sp. FACHB-110]MBD2439067.1 ABC transporter substrate-binding protein [Nostoc sp. FACHB-110]
MRAYCTNPHCRYPENDIPEEFRQTKGQQRYCANCGMRLILKSRYLPLEPIGSGGFSRTFRAWDCNLEHECLIKQLRPKNLSHSAWSDAQLEYVQNAFKREAQTLRNLNHPQIPRLWDFFELAAPPQEEYHEPENAGILFYLVQDYIEGQNLRQLKNEKWSEAEIIKLLQQLLPVLDYIHNLQPVMLIHRDIKPENIIFGKNQRFYLIDFGAVKQAIAGIPAEQSIAISTPGYASPEQRAGLAVSASSDLYALAATCVCLLTLQPTENLRLGDIWSWRKYVDVSDQLATILDTMLSFEINHRFQSARQVIEVLDNQRISAPTPLPEPLTSVQIPNTPIATPPETQSQTPSLAPVKPSLLGKKLLLGGLGSVILLGLGIWQYLHTITPALPPLCIDDSRFSCGEKRFIPLPLGLQDNPYIQKGITAFQNKDFSLAISSFEDYLKKVKKNDPEIRIYLNNAIAAKSNQFYKITVCVPIGNENPLAEEILRGVAIVQDDLNTNPSKLINKKMLLVQICNDEQKTMIAQQVAKQIVEQDKQTLGVIGHNSSILVLEAGQIYSNTKYGDERIVSISPTSTAVRGTKFHGGDTFKLNFNLDKFVFRVSPSDDDISKSLVNYIRKKQGNKIAIFLNKEEPYSTSFSQQFKKNLGKAGEIVNECDLSNPLKDVSPCLQSAKKSQANFILLTMSDDILDKEINRILQGSGDAVILGGDTSYVDSAQITQIKYGKMVVAIPWHRSSNNPFSLEKQSQKIWGTTKISYATAMAYDATQALVEGLKRSGVNPTRKRVYEELNQPDFSVKGAKTEVQFNENHDRRVDESNIKDLVVLVSPKDGAFQVIK